MITQVDGSLERSRGGLGIGLSLVKKLVEMHGGSVEARSDGRGLGSEFIVRLPLPGVRDKTRPVAPGQPLAPPPRLRILVVDDNIDAANSLSKLLRVMGHDTETAHDGVAAVEMAAAFQPDLIMLDIGMPKLNGYEVCRRIRGAPWGEKIIVVALMGYGQDHDREQSDEAGFNDHMVKPVHPADLANFLARLQGRTT
jgi:CheY-like chemotaxis protein